MSAPLGTVGEAAPADVSTERVIPAPPPAAGAADQARPAPVQFEISAVADYDPHRSSKHQCAFNSVPFISSGNWQSTNHVELPTGFERFNRDDWIGETVPVELRRNPAVLFVPLLEEFTSLEGDCPQEFVRTDPRSNQHIDLFRLPDMFR